MQTSRTWPGILLACLMLPAPGNADPLSDDGFDRIVGFGDSLSDPGNNFALYGRNLVPPYAPIPDAPYAIGGNRFSDGTVWLEQLATALGRPLDGKPAYRSGRPFSSYAVGGARARVAGNAPNLSVQVAAFLASNRDQPLDDDLFVIWFGANDIRDALTALSTAATAQEFDAALAIVPEALAATAFNIQALYAAGARSFLVPSVPNLAVTPAVRALGPDAVATAGYLSASYRVELNAILDTLGLALPGVEFYRLDVWTLIEAIAASPETFGLANADAPCLSFGVISSAVCEERSQYLFWDAIHPTQAAHRILAQHALELVDAGSE